METEVPGEKVSWGSGFISPISSLRFRPERLAYMLHEHQVTAHYKETRLCCSGAWQLGSQYVSGCKRGDGTPNVFSRLKRLAPLQTPGSGLWNMLSTKPSAHTSCLPSISQKMGMSCSLLTCPTCTKSLRGVKYAHLRTRLCSSPFAP